MMVISSIPAKPGGICHSKGLAILLSLDKS